VPVPPVDLLAAPLVDAPMATPARVLAMPPVDIVRTDIDVAPTPDAANLPAASGAGRRNMLVAVLALVLVAAVIVWFVNRPQQTVPAAAVAPAPSAAPKTTPAPAPPAPAPAQPGQTAASSVPAPTPTAAPSTAATPASPPAATANPKASPAPPASGAAPGARGSFEIVVASFRTEPRAVAVAAQVSDAGLPVRRREVGGWLQVLSGPFPSREDADAARQRLEAAGLSGTQIVSIDR
jgi:hypothetical protein